MTKSEGGAAVAKQRGGEAIGRSCALGLAEGCQALTDFVGANGVRVATTGLLSEIDTKLATGVYHEVEGYIVYIVALLALLAVHRLINVVARKWGKA